MRRTCYVTYNTRTSCIASGSIPHRTCCDSDAHSDVGVVFSAPELGAARHVPRQWLTIQPPLLGSALGLPCRAKRASRELVRKNLRSSSPFLRAYTSMPNGLAAQIGLNRHTERTLSPRFPRHRSSFLTAGIALHSLSLSLSLYQGGRRLCCARFMERPDKRPVMGAGRSANAKRFPLCRQL